MGNQSAAAADCNPHYRRPSTEPRDQPRACLGLVLQAVHAAFATSRASSGSPFAPARAYQPMVATSWPRLVIASVKIPTPHPPTVSRHRASAPAWRSEGAGRKKKCRPKAASLHPCVRRFWPRVSSNGLRRAQNDPPQQRNSWMLLNRKPVTAAAVSGRKEPSFCPVLALIQPSS